MIPTFITGSAFKLDLFRRFCSLPIEHQDIDLTEIQSMDPKEIVEHKTKEAYRIVGGPVLVEDVSLRIEGMGGLPGPFIKFFIKELSYEKICRMTDVVSPHRKATAEVLYGLYDGEHLHFFHNAIEGSIAQEPRGEAHGFQPIFIPAGETKTWAEMTPEEQLPSSLRKPALEELETFLTSRNI